MITPALRFQLLQAARQVLEQAYAPYSRFRVGAALLTRQGGVFTGANVENASYGLTLCAERAAIAVAVAAEGPGVEIRALAVVSESQEACPPCGACRQVILEFGKKALIIFQGPDGLMEMPVEDLLPAAFCLCQKK
ncbi:MAG: cytidine deaminase [Deltaproteobacteria bacterium]|nr:cytidine deaminase [Deltaproteobacteria bacterium]